MKSDILELAEKIVNLRCEHTSDAMVANTEAGIAAKVISSQGFCSEQSDQESALSASARQ